MGQSVGQIILVNKRVNLYVPLSHAQLETIRISDLWKLLIVATKLARVMNDCPAVVNRDEFVPPVPFVLEKL